MVQNAKQNNKLKLLTVGIEQGIQCKPQICLQITIIISRTKNHKFKSYKLKFQKSYKLKFQKSQLISAVTD